ncbi:MAG: DUF6607 family protein [Cyclobacteriaceae bacterium]
MMIKSTRSLGIILMLLIACGTVSAQKSKKQDIKSIKDMCGCYLIKFNFAETFSPDPNYKFYDNYLSGGLEYVFPVEESKDKIVLQHLLVIGDSMIIKHWRQDWLYENTDLYTFHKENTWHYNSLPSSSVKGQWTQKVYQVDDSPRYEGSGSWVHKDGKHYWEATADAPLPRREFSQRSDYNVMARRNRQEITDYGWVHEQDNKKILREADDKHIASEKGWNTYTKVADEKCQLAKDWWSTNSAYWNDVRVVWDELFAKNETVKINMKVDDTLLFMRLFGLGDEFAGTEYDSDEAKKKIREAINLHLAEDARISFN